MIAFDKKLMKQGQNKVVAFYSSTFFLTLCFFNFFLLIFLNKKVDLASISILGINFRFPQLFSLLLIPLVFQNIKKNAYLILFLFFGFINLVSSIKYDFRYSLANFGIYYYSVYFFLGYLLAQNNYYKVFFKALPLMTTIGILNFIINNFYEKGALPIGIHMSSDILPILSLICIFIVTQDKSYSYLKKILYSSFYLSFIFLVKIKGPVLVLLGISFLIRFNKLCEFIKFFLMLILVFVSIKFFFDEYFFTTIFFIIKENFKIGQDQLFNIGSRLLMWEEATKYIKDNYLLGYGIIPLGCESIEVLWPNWIGSSSENVNPHNSYLFLTYFGGILSLLLFFRVTFFDLINRKHLDYFFYLPVLILLLLGFITPILEIYYIAPFLWLFVGGVFFINKHFFQQSP